MYGSAFTKAFTMNSKELSDHYPVVANFAFFPTKLYFKKLDGCKFDSDCTFDMMNLNCKCTGDNCTYKDDYYKSNTGWLTENIKAKDGTDLSDTDSVLNQKCRYQVALAQCFCRPGGKF